MALAKPLLPLPLFGQTQLPVAAPAVEAVPAWQPGGWPFGDLPPGRFGLIYLDPPWEQEFYGDETGIGKAPQKHYSCMSLDDIGALPVAQLAAPDCFLVMWSLWNFVSPGYASDVIRTWGFEPKSGGGWWKITKGDKDAFGTGYGFRGCCEPYLTASIGRPKIQSKSERNGVLSEIGIAPDLELNGLLAKLREHSRKPDEMRSALERMFPHVPKVELFARQPSPGWSVWGNEINKFAEGQP